MARRIAGPMTGKSAFGQWPRVAPDRGGERALHRRRRSASGSSIFLSSRRSASRSLPSSRSAAAAARPGPARRAARGRGRLGARAARAAVGALHVRRHSAFLNSSASRAARSANSAPSAARSALRVWSSSASRLRAAPSSVDRRWSSSVKLRRLARQLAPQFALGPGALLARLRQPALGVPAQLLHGAGELLQLARSGRAVRRRAGRPGRRSPAGCTPPARVAAAELLPQVGRVLEQPLLELREAAVVVPHLGAEDDVADLVDVAGAPRLAGPGGAGIR